MKNIKKMNSYLIYVAIYVWFAQCKSKCALYQTLIIFCISIIIVMACPSTSNSFLPTSHADVITGYNALTLYPLKSASRQLSMKIDGTVRTILNQINLKLSVFINLSRY